MNNADTARHVIDLVSSYQFDDLAPFIHDDIIMEAPYQAFHTGPMRRGKEGFMNGMRFVPGVFKTFSLNIHELYDCPEQQVVVLEMTSLGVFLSNDASYQNRYCLIFEFKDGKICLWREFFNPEIMNAGMISMSSG
ncbi:MAG: nuclear transport factor 2 family protein [Pseudomonadota bacterium]